MHESAAVDCFQGIPIRKPEDLGLCPFVEYIDQETSRLFHITFTKDGRCYVVELCPTGQVRDTDGAIRDERILLDIEKRVGPNGFAVEAARLGFPIERIVRAACASSRGGGFDRVGAAATAIRACLDGNYRLHAKGREA